MINATIKEMKANWRVQGGSAMDFANQLEGTFKSSYYVTAHGQPFKCALLSMLVKEIERIGRQKEHWAYHQPFRLNSDLDVPIEATLEKVQRNIEQINHNGRELAGLGVEIERLGQEIMGSLSEGGIQKVKQLNTRLFAQGKTISESQRMDHSMRNELLAVSPLSSRESAESAVDIYTYNHEIYIRTYKSITGLLGDKWSQAQKDDIEATFNKICGQRDDKKGVLNVILIPRELVADRLIYPSYPYGRKASISLEHSSQARILLKAYAEKVDEIFTVRLSDDSKEFMREAKKMIKGLARRLLQFSCEYSNCDIRPALPRICKK